MDLTSPKSVSIRKSGPKRRWMKQYESMGVHFWQELEMVLEGYSPGSSASPLTTDLKNQSCNLAFHFGKVVCLWSGHGIFSHLFSHKALSKLRFLYFQPATAGQRENKPVGSKKTLQSFHCNFSKETSSWLVIINWWPWASNLSYFKLLDLTL